MRASRGWLMFLSVLMVLTSGMAVLAATGVADTITLELKDVEVRSAVEALFRNSGKNFSIDQNVQGNVSSLSFKDVPFETALKNLTKSTGLVYRVDAGVYIISKRPDIPATMTSAYGGMSVPVAEYVDPTTPASELTIEKIPLNYTSASEILAVMSGSGRDFASMYGQMGLGGRYQGNGQYGGGYGQYGGGGYSPYGGGYGGGNSNYGGYGGGYSPYGGGNSNYGGRSNYGNYGGYGGTGGGNRGW